MLHPGLGGHRHLTHHAPCYRTPDLAIADVMSRQSAIASRMRLTKTTHWSSLDATSMG